MNALTPYICVPDSRAAMAWYGDAIGAEVVLEPIVMDDGSVGHVEMAIGDARWMMSDEYPDHDVAAPDPLRGAAVSLHLTVDDVDRVCERVRAGGVSLARGPEDTPHGRVAVFRDPFGHRWFLNQEC